MKTFPPQENVKNVDFYALKGKETIQKVPFIYLCNFDVKEYSLNCIEDLRFWWIALSQ